MAARRRRRLRTAASLLLALPLLAGTPAGPGSFPSAHAQQPAQPTHPAQETGTGNRTATVAITGLTPAAPQPGDTVTVRGTVTNKGASPIVGSSLAAREGVRLTSRSALSRALRRTDFSPQADGSIVLDHGQDIGTIAPGMSATFALDLPVSALALEDDGVYQLAVALTGQTEDRRWEQILGAGRTLLPWRPDGSTNGDDGDADGTDTGESDTGGSTAQTELAVLWPLVSSAHLTSRTGSDEAQTPAFRDDSLLEEISPGGRLHRMVTLGAGLPVTWVVDPDLLASVDAMTEEYQVYDDTGRLVPGEGQEHARAWLGTLQDAVRDAEIVTLPFGDPDLASLAHQGKDVPGTLSELREATEVAGLTVETVLGVAPGTDYAWPVEGAIDPEIVSVAISAGADRVLTRSDSLRPARDLPYTTNAARPIGGGTTAVVADATLSALFQGDMSRTAAVSQARQQLLAQTLSITEQLPADERSILLAPQRMPSAEQAEAMAAAVGALAEHAGWVEFAGLEETAGAEPDPRANRQVPAPGQYPERLRAQELPTSAFQAMRETRRTLEDFQVVLTSADRVMTPFGNAIRREMSVSWRTRAAEATAYRDAVQSDLVRLTERVHLIQKSPITLSGRSATIPVTVQNNLVQDVQGLELRLESSRRLGLEVSEPQQIAVNGGHSQSVKFSTTARANGRIFLRAQLFTADGKPYGEPMRFQADVTSITSAVLIVIAGGLLLVVLAGIRMYSQRKRAAQAAAAAAQGPVGESSTDTGDGSGPSPGEGERLDRDQ